MFVLAVKRGVRIAHTTTATGLLVSVVTVTLGILGLESLI